MPWFFFSSRVDSTRFISSHVRSIRVGSIDVGSSPWSSERRAERNQRAETEDFDGEELEALNDEQAAEDEVFDQFAECVGSLLRSLHAPVLPTLEPLLVQYVAPMLAPGRSPEVGGAGG